MKMSSHWLSGCLILIFVGLTLACILATIGLARILPIA